ncbi:putative zinc-binding protein [Clostridium boliviensis]|uniref:Zinc-binding protein n=1 Tax=Clostridium boliviensis TaxID=318465 RepID=A0ABU4GTC3_9CLOT|nr:putative zinc-binding protein [Clostridium boliviensis]MDW2800188.1 putative zinc-binding protein [Clostridium boliviensis]
MKKILKRYRAFWVVLVLLLVIPPVFVLLGLLDVDGCPMSCAKKTLEKAGFNTDEHIVVTKDLTVSKNFYLNSSPDLEKIKDAVVEKINRVYDK